MGRIDLPVKILDEKGRLFGKLNLIDLLVILLVIVTAVLFLVNREPPEETENPGTTYELTYQVLVRSLSPEVCEVIQKYVDPEQGLEDRLFSSDSGNKYLDAYVVDCVVNPHIEYVATTDGEIKVVESSGKDRRLDATLTIRATVTDLMTNLVGIQQVRAGIGHYLKTTHFECSGTILSVDWEDQ